MARGEVRTLAVELPAVTGSTVEQEQGWAVAGQLVVDPDASQLRVAADVRSCGSARRSPHATCLRSVPRRPSHRARARRTRAVAGAPRAAGARLRRSPGTSPGAPRTPRGPRD